MSTQQTVIFTRSTLNLNVCVFYSELIMQIFLDIPQESIVQGIVIYLYMNGQRDFGGA
ncbi:hypothetical protein [Congregibacter sp.]|jgi:hypothetical protein|uniref:hypothetical protein n=1 Tax=Congregibacter sp. TaxID=2744308 RepID=UPI0039E6A07B